MINPKLIVSGIIFTALTVTLPVKNAWGIDTQALLTCFGDLQSKATNSARGPQILLGAPHDQVQYYHEMRFFSEPKMDSEAMLWVVTGPRLYVLKTSGLFQVQIPQSISKKIQLQVGDVHLTLEKTPKGNLMLRDSRLWRDVHMNNASLLAIQKSPEARKKIFRELHFRLGLFGSVPSCVGL